MDEAVVVNKYSDMRHLFRILAGCEKHKVADSGIFFFHLYAEFRLFG